MDDGRHGTQLAAARLLITARRGQRRRRLSRRGHGRAGQGVRFGNGDSGHQRRAAGLGRRRYSRNSPLERYVRDARMFAIAGGTAQILRTLVASRILNRASRRPATGI